MSDHTAISWTDATWNPIRGCTRVSAGCDNCYAEAVARRFAGPGQPYEGTVSAGGGWNGRIREVASVLDQPSRWRRPRRIFVNSMSDLFHPGVTVPWRDAVFDEMERNPRHTFQILTKRPLAMRRYLDQRWVTSAVAPAHIWLGVSVEDTTQEARIRLLRATPARVRFVSAEPLLGSLAGVSLAGLDWLIVGGESGPNARPCAIDWITEAVVAAEAAGVAVFVKQFGSLTARALGWKHRAGADPAEWTSRNDGQPGSPEAVKAIGKLFPQQFPSVTS